MGDSFWLSKLTFLERCKKIWKSICWSKAGLFITVDLPDYLLVVSLFVCLFVSAPQVYYLQFFYNVQYCMIVLFWLIGGHLISPRGVKMQDQRRPTENGGLIQNLQSHYSTIHTRRYEKTTEELLVLYEWYSSIHKYSYQYLLCTIPYIIICTDWWLMNDDWW